ncbi:lipopolysaccharide kinase InaA family protein [Myxococcota bacterium]|nr:lipopolysaccharide kinase InaA family protein [Myxococcota bacterium]
MAIRTVVQMSEAWQWVSGRLSVQRAIEDWYSTPSSGESCAQILRDNPYRRTVRIKHDGSALLIKHFRCGSHGRSRREQLKAALGLQAGQREARQNKAFARRDLPVAEMIAQAKTPDRDFIVVLRWIDALTLREIVQREGPTAKAPLMAVAEIIRRMHDAGFGHGDLHAENILVPASGPRLIDLHRSRKARRGSRFQARDLGLLDYSLCELGISPADRIQVLQSCLGYEKQPSETDHPPSLRPVLRQAERIRSELTERRLQRGESPIEGAHWHPSNF